MFKPTAKPAKGLHGPMHTKGAAAPIKVGKGYRFTFAYSVNDLETITDLRGDA